MTSRPSEDIDLFSSERGGPGEVEDDLVAGYRRHGYTVTVLRSTPDLVQLTIEDDQGYECKVDLGVFWRAHLPVLLDIGPVLHPDDAVGGKMDALYNRWAPRDFLDVDAILQSGRYTRADLLIILAEHNPGYDRSAFAESLSYLHRVPDRDFAAYGVDPLLIGAMRTRFADWERDLRA